MLHRRKLLSVVLSLLVMFSSVSLASAAWMRCRSDPVVLLSNGMTLDLSADISVLPWQVEHVDYILHVPQDVSLVASIATPSWPTAVETFTLYNDAPSGEYHTETIVYTSQGNAAATAHTILLSIVGIQLDSVSVSGMEGEILHAYVHVP